MNLQIEMNPAEEALIKDGGYNTKDFNERCNKVAEERRKIQGQLDVFLNQINFIELDKRNEALKKALDEINKIKTSYSSGLKIEETKVNEIEVGKNEEQGAFLIEFEFFKNTFSNFREESKLTEGEKNMVIAEIFKYGQEKIKEIKEKFLEEIISEYYKLENEQHLKETESGKQRIQELKEMVKEFFPWDNFFSNVYYQGVVQQRKANKEVVGIEKLIYEAKKIIND